MVGVARPRGSPGNLGEPGPLCVVANHPMDVARFSERLRQRWWPPEESILQTVVVGDLHYVPALSAFDNVMLGSASSLRSASAVRSVIRRSDPEALKLARALGVENLSGNPTDRFERELLCVARGFRSKPDLLVLASPLNQFPSRTAAAILELIDDRTGDGLATIYGLDHAGTAFEAAGRAAIVRDNSTMFFGDPQALAPSRARLLASANSQIARDLAEAVFRSRLAGCRTRESLADIVLGLVEDVVGDRSIIVVLDAETPVSKVRCGSDGDEKRLESERWFLERWRGATHTETGSPIESAEVFSIGRDVGWIAIFDDGDDVAAFPIATLMPAMESLLVARGAEIQSVHAARYINRAEAVRTLVGGIAHDFNNSLQSVFGLLEIVDRANDNPDLRPHLSTLRLVATDAASFVSKLVAFSRASDFHVDRVDMHEVVRDAAEIVARGVDSAITFDLDLQAGEPWVDGDAPELRNLFVNLLLNSVQAVPHSTGRVSVRSTFDDVSRQILIRVSDDGCGISDVALAHVFEPFVTTRGPSVGTGMGLAIAHGTVEDHNGSIEIESTSAEGTTVLVQFTTIVGSGIEPEPEIVAPTVPTSRPATVLICDDQPLVLDVLEEMVRLAGYEVVTATNGTRCLEIFRRAQQEIGLVIVDQLMPGMHGDVVIDHLRAIDPDVLVAWISGYRFVETESEKVPDVFARLSKPINLVDLEEVLMRASEDYGRRRAEIER